MLRGGVDSGGSTLLRAGVCCGPMLCDFARSGMIVRFFEVSDAHFVYFLRVETKNVLVFLSRA